MADNTRRQYDAEFKSDAVALADEPGRAAADVAESLGIRTELIYRWRREQKRKAEGAFPGHGREALTDQEKKIRELEKKLRDSEMEREILKKAVAIFSKAPK